MTRERQFWTSKSGLRRLLIILQKIVDVCTNFLDSQIFYNGKTKLYPKSTAYIVIIICLYLDGFNLNLSETI